MVGGYYISLLAINYIVKPDGDLERALKDKDEELKRALRDKDSDLERSLKKKDVEIHTF